MRKFPTVLFVDGTCPSPYDPETLKTGGLGGTEATVIRIAEGLAATGLFNVIVEQHNRAVSKNPPSDGPGVRWSCPDEATHADYVISLRYPQLIPHMQKRFPSAKHYLWNHDLLQPSYADEMVKLTNYISIAVSNYHKTQMQCVLGPQGYEGQFPIKVAYNPIAEDLTYDDTPFDKNKLVWMSSPHKGLEQALQIFTNLLSFNPDFKLYIANPGYIPHTHTSSNNIIILGSISHKEVISHLRSSLCLFYPNFVFPETFGLVLSEANAVGTPVITHPIGAATEVLCHPYETLDCRNPKLVIDRVMAWRDGDRPRVRANPKFRLSNVLKSWMRLFSAGE